MALEPFAVFLCYCLSKVAVTISDKSGFIS